LLAPIIIALNQTKVNKKGGISLEKFYSCEQVADRYGVKIETVWAWIREKKLPAVKIGKIYRVKESDLVALEHKNKTTE
jgi:excisionase family DNA binding protein